VPKALAKRLDAQAGSGPRREVERADQFTKGKRSCGLLSSLVLLRLAAPPLQLGVVGPYLVQGVLFPSHLPLEGTGHIKNFGS
jgi:hypothetical protein